MFCGYVCMPPPMTFNNTINTLHSDVEVAGNEMKESTRSLRKQTLKHYVEDMWYCCVVWWHLAMSWVLFLEWRSKCSKYWYRTFLFGSFLEMGMCSSILNFDSGTHSMTKIGKSWNEVWFLYGRVFYETRWKANCEDVTKDVDWV